RRRPPGVRAGRLPAAVHRLRHARCRGGPPGIVRRAVTVRLRVQSSQGPPADYDLDGPEILIGRATTSTIVIADARASRQHARVSRRDDGWWIEARGARNPTLLNGVAVTGSFRLSAGDSLEIGDSVVQFLGE